MTTTAPLSRSDDGRWLAGVCAGLARARQVPVGLVRAAFVAGALAGGLGVLVYLACWLIVPAAGAEAVGRGPAGIVVLARAAAGCVGLATLAAVAAAATVFGFGWAIVAGGGLALVAALALWPRVRPAWVLLPLGALAVPAVAFAAGGVRLAAQAGRMVVAPRQITDIPSGGYRSGLGTLLVDLRHTALPATGTTDVRIDAGVRRTIVALPHDRCVYVDLRFHVDPFAAQVLSLLGTHRDAVSGQIAVFDSRSAGMGEIGNLPALARAPTLRIDFSSAGGGLYVRDYPDAVDPEAVPDWPGDPRPPEPHPDTAGFSSGAARAVVAGWAARHRRELAALRTREALGAGPCATGAHR